MRRLGLLIGIVGALALGAMWVAEGSRFPLSFLANPRIRPGTMVIVVACGVVVATALLSAAVLRPYSAVSQGAGTVALLLGIIAGVTAGDYSNARAFNECVRQAPVVQNHLSAFKRQNGHYPPSLSEMGTVPCRRCLRGTILEYSSDGSTYAIGFRDWLVTWKGSDREPITASK